MFRNFRNQDTQQSLQESSMKLLNLLGIKWSTLADDFRTWAVPALPDLSPLSL